MSALRPLAKTFCLQLIVVVCLCAVALAVLDLAGVRAPGPAPSAAALPKASSVGETRPSPDPNAPPDTEVTASEPAPAIAGADEVPAVIDPELLAAYRAAFTGGEADAPPDDDHPLASDTSLANAAVLVTDRVRTTAYTHTEADHIKYGNKTALGTVLRYSKDYHSVAADWSRFPLGTKFRIKGFDRLFVVDDYGKALVGTRTIDIYFLTKERMNHWGVRWLDIEVLEFGSFHESRKILAARANHPHCLEMLASMTNDDWWKSHR